MAGPMDHRASVSDFRAALQKWLPEAIPVNEVPDPSGSAAEWR